MSEPLILVPGLLCDAALWLHQRRHLGAGRAIVVADHATAASIDGTAQAILRAAPDRFALAGLSMGGYVALELIRRAPHRVTRLALLDTNAHADTPAATERRTAQVARARGGDFAGVVDDLLPLLLAPAAQACSAITTTVRAMAARAGVDVFARQQAAIMGRRDQMALLATIKVPTLVLCGADDALTPPAVHEAMAAAIPGARYVDIAGAGHLAPIEAPDAVTNAMARWLA